MLMTSPRGNEYRRLGLRETLGEFLEARLERVLDELSKLFVASCDPATKACE
jgi:hypothetical protein